jgi:hypothetical protein
MLTVACGVCRHLYDLHETRSRPKNLTYQDNTETRTYITPIDVATSVGT